MVVLPEPTDDLWTPRKPYEAPRVVEDAPLEHMSLACAKLANGACNSSGSSGGKT